MREAAIGALLHEFNYLKLDQKGVEDFVDDFLPFYYWEGRLKNAMVIKTLYAFNIKADSAVSLFNSGMFRLMAETYLLSTDFFSNNMDESRTLKYVGLYSPHLKPCANPFSFIHYPPEVS
ncbi:hypothetical protein GCM10027443_07520 [Pontibacter brevis]